MTHCAMMQGWMDATRMMNARQGYVCDGCGEKKCEHIETQSLDPEERNNGHF